MSEKALILGANGRFGRHASAAFRTSGWHVTPFDRAQGDLRRAVQDADVVVNAWNPPNYATWHKELPALHQSVIEASRNANATIIVPGNVYVFGVQTPGPWSETTPHAATNPLGQLRIRMEEAYRSSGTQTILLRGGDFLDTEPSGNWFDQVIIKPVSKGHISYPGRLDAPHAWAFLPDMTRAAVALAENRAELPQFSDVPFPGYTLSGQDLADLLSAALQKNLRAKKMKWWPLDLLSPVWPMVRGLREMRYLWDTPHSLDGVLLHKLLPDFAPTPIAEAIRRAAGR